MKIKWSLDINTGGVERSEAARALRLAGAVCGTNFSGGGLFLPLNKFRPELILGGPKLNVTPQLVRLPYRTGFPHRFKSCRLCQCSNGRKRAAAISQRLTEKQ